MFPAAGAATCPRVGRPNRFLFAIFFLSPLATSVAPRLTPLFFALVCIALIGAALRREIGWRQLLPRGQALHVLAVWLLLAVYVALNATWSAERLDGFGKAAMLAGLALISFAAVAAASVLDKRILVRAGLFFAAGAFLGCLFILLELLTDGIMTRTVMNWIPLLQPSSAKRLKIEHDQVTRIKLSELDPNVNLAMFHFWPGLLALSGLKARRAVAMTVFFVTLAAVVMTSEHASSQMALVGSGIVALLGWRWRPQAVIRTLTVLWCAAFVLVIPASFIAYQTGLHLATWLPVSARHRIILWQSTAEQVLAHPLLGIGVKSTPVLTKRQKTMGPIDQPEGFVKPRGTGHHAHNIFLHSFYELGALGAFLFAIACATVAMLILYLPGSAQPFAAGTFAAFALVSAFAWGMWQTWFMCAAGLLPLYLRVGAATCEGGGEASAPHNSRGTTAVLLTKEPP
jgi:O-Antigen ligase